MNQCFDYTVIDAYTERTVKRFGRAHASKAGVFAYILAGKLSAACMAEGRLVHGDIRPAAKTDLAV